MNVLKKTVGIIRTHHSILQQAQYALTLAPSYVVYNLKTSQILISLRDWVMRTLISSQTTSCWWHIVQSLYK